MTKQELMKELYKQKPTAFLKRVTKEGIEYECELIEGACPVHFVVPLNELGDTSFDSRIPAHLLSRYAVEPIMAY